MDLDSSTTPVAPTKPEPSLVRTRTLAVFTALAMAAGFGAGWFSHTSSSGGSGGTSGATTAVHGTLTLTTGGYTSNSGVCNGAGGFQDISAGVAVTIGDQTGKTLTITSLQPGNVASGNCVFAFSAQVGAATSYTVTISHRGTQVFPATDAAGGFNVVLNAN